MIGSSTAATTANSFSPSKRPPFAMNTSDRHLRFGWWSLFTFLALGLGLEILHGFKLGWYLDVGNETRRLMFTLAHSHGTLLALVNLAAGLTARSVKGFALPDTASHALMWGAILMPVGFFLGGVVIHDGDPGLGIALAPAGALLLLYGVFGAARAFGRVPAER